MRGIFLLFVSLVLLQAEVSELRIAKQYGLGALPFNVLDEFKLVQKHAKAAGLGDVKVTWATFGGGAATNDALLSGNIDINYNGIAPFVILWDKSKGKVKAIAAAGEIPIVLNTVNPNVKSIKDLTDSDRIALPAAKVSIQAILLQIETAKIYGIKNFDKFDHLTVTLKDPDAIVALTSKNPQITTHFTSEPFASIEQQNPNVRQLLTLESVLGKSYTAVVISTTEKFYKANPKTVKALVDALDEANRWIENNKEEAVRLYLKANNSKEPFELIYSILNRPNFKFTIKPTDITVFSDFLYETGTIKSKPTQKELFFEGALEEESGGGCG
ncbi:MAG: ABC transporter substrate-binding protein [Campylobacteraceae bacterium]|jgi:NitT/TauT family transport system substrate-binding protein|nr:ABC transporter substrate-binding protein [Campylobacteraceae bacterium]